MSKKKGKRKKGIIYRIILSLCRSANKVYKTTIKGKRW